MYVYLGVGVQRAERQNFKNLNSGGAATTTRTTSDLSGLLQLARKHTVVDADAYWKLVRRVISHMLASGRSELSQCGRVVAISLLLISYKYSVDREGGTFR